MYVCMYIYIYIYTHTHTHTCVCVCMYVFIHTVDAAGGSDAAEEDEALCRAAIKVPALLLLYCCFTSVLLPSGH